jgi:hypothetical protein
MNVNVAMFKLRMPGGCQVNACKRPETRQLASKQYFNCANSLPSAALLLLPMDDCLQL